MDSQTSTTLAIAAGLSAGLLGVLYLANAPKGSKTAPKREPNTVYIHVPKPNKLFGLFSPSVVGLKLETWLRVAKIPHEVIRTETAARYSPDGTLPFIEYNGVYMSKPQEIVEYLKTATKSNPDAALTPSQRATGYLVERILERNLVDLLVTLPRKTSPLVVQRDIQFYFPLNMVPVPLIKPFVAAAVCCRKGKYNIPDEKRKAQAKADLTALSDLLGRNDYITGSSKPSSADATLYAVLVNATEATIKDDEIARWIGTLNGGNLTQYIQRMRTVAWADWANNQEKLQYRAGS